MDDRQGTGAWDDALHRPGDVVGGTSRPGFAGRLDRWLADARIDDAAAERTRERWLRSVAEQEATFAGVLLDLAERHAGVSLATSASRRLTGTIEAIGGDFVAVRLAAGRETLVALRAIAVVRTAPSVEATVGDRVVTTELSLAEVLAGLAAERERVLILSGSGDDAVTGTLRSVGHDVVVVRTDSEPAATAYVQLAGIAEVAIG